MTKEGTGAGAAEGGRFLGEICRFFERRDAK